MDKTNETVKVGIRVRPFTKKEQSEGETEIAFGQTDRNEIILKPAEAGHKATVFTFDYVFGKESQQETVYTQCASSIVDSLLQGFNCTIFAYGQTGTGKTYTMEGSEDCAGMGIIPRTFEHIFRHIQNNSSKQQFLVRCSMLELYNEELKDPLSDKKEKLEIHEDVKNGFYVKGLSQASVTSASELQEKLNTGKATRRVRATQMNDFSSRSHSIFCVIVESSQLGEDGKTHFKVGKLNLVDLAGSEKQKQTKTSNEALKEGININLSLTTLGNVINLLIQSASHIPYRNSKLTKLLSDSLGGNSCTLMLANIGPARSNHAETHQTLKYASRAKQIKNKPVINEDPKDTLLRKKQDELLLLKRQIEEMSSSLKGIPLVMALDDKENVPTAGLPHMSIKNIQKEGDNLEEEKNKLQKKVNDAQEKAKVYENEKRDLIRRYNSMCKDIITEHNYAADLLTAKNELDTIVQQALDPESILETKKLFHQKKIQVTKFDAKTKQTQDKINDIDATISDLREKMSFYKADKLCLTQSSLLRISDLNNKISDTKVTLKRQYFFMQNLIPKHFQLLQEFCVKGEEMHRSIEPFSLHLLRRPISLETLGELSDNYINPYIKDLPPKKVKLEFPHISQILSEGSIIRELQPERKIFKVLFVLLPIP